MTKLAPLLFFLLSACGAQIIAPALMSGGISAVSPLSPLKTARESFVVRAEGTGPIELETVMVNRRGVTLTGKGTFSRPLAIRSAFLTAVTAPPCTQGASLQALWLEQDRRWDRPVAWTGAHHFELAFATPRGFLREPTALDVQLIDGDQTGQPDSDLCIRLPLRGSASASTLRRESAWTSGGGLGVSRAQWKEGEIERRGNGLGIHLHGSSGAWSGLWRASVRGDLFITARNTFWTLSLPMAVAIERLFPVSRHASWGLGLGYQPGRIEDLPSLWTSRRSWSHGPRATVMLLGGRGVADADPGQGFATRGIGLFVMRQWNTVIDIPEAPPPAWILGLEALSL
ncbi:MAG TPA: hypothetical protein VGG33_05540 [Polyangia bacterium]